MVATRRSGRGGTHSRPGGPSTPAPAAASRRTTPQPHQSKLRDSTKPSAKPAATLLEFPVTPTPLPERQKIQQRRSLAGFRPRIVELDPSTDETVAPTPARSEQRRSVASRQSAASSAPSWSPRVIVSSTRLETPKRTGRQFDGAFVRPRTPQGQKTPAKSAARSPHKTAIAATATEQDSGDSADEGDVEADEGDAQELDEAEESGEESEVESEVQKNMTGAAADEGDEPEEEAQDRDEDDAEDEDNAEDEDVVEDSDPTDSGEEDNQLEALSPSKRKLGQQTSVARRRSSSDESSPAAKRRVSRQSRAGGRRTGTASSRAGHSRHEDKENLPSRSRNHETSGKSSQSRSSKHSSMQKNSSSRVSVRSGGYGDADDSALTDKRQRASGKVTSQPRSRVSLAGSRRKRTSSSDMNESETTEPNTDPPQYRNAIRKRKTKRHRDASRTCVQTPLRVGPIPEQRILQKQRTALSSSRSRRRPAAGTSAETRAGGSSTVLQPDLEAEVSDSSDPEYQAEGEPSPVTPTPTSTGRGRGRDRGRGGGQSRDRSAGNVTDSSDPEYQAEGEPSPVTPTPTSTGRGRGRGRGGGGGQSRGRSAGKGPGGRGRGPPKTSAASAALCRCRVEVAGRPRTIRADNIQDVMEALTDVLELVRDDPLRHYKGIDTLVEGLNSSLTDVLRRVEGGEQGAKDAARRIARVQTKLDERVLKEKPALLKKYMAAREEQKKEVGKMRMQHWLRWAAHRRPGDTDEWTDPYPAVTAKPV